jgi:hypothetical protein
MHSLRMLEIFVEGLHGVGLMGCFFFDKNFFPDSVSKQEAGHDGEVMADPFCITPRSSVVEF